MIDPRADIHPSARLGSNVSVGPWSIIGPDVEIGDDTVIGPHVVVRGPTRIGKANRIYQFATVGEECQDKKYRGEATTLVIGDRNVIRESCTLHRGTVQDQGTTVIGSDNLLMVNVHVAHDCMIGDDNIFANNTALAGHVHVGSGVILGGFTGVHQFCRIGDHCMSGVGSVVLKDIPAYVMVSGNPAAAHGMNYEGMRRRGWSNDTVQTLRQAYRIVYRSSLTLEEALQQLDSLQECVELQPFVMSLRASTRGIVR